MKWPWQKDRYPRTTHWNHRVVHRTYPDIPAQEEWAIHEVYYDGERPHSMTVDPVTPWGESLEELAESVEMFRLALEKPVLEYDDFPG